jgi:hypothetical protein
MEKPWPPKAPNVADSFDKARRVQNDNPTPEPPREMITKQKIEALEKQRKNAARAPELTPPGMKRSTPAPDPQREARLQRMKQRMQEKKEKVRDDFNRSREM